MSTILFYHVVCVLHHMEDFFTHSSYDIIHYTKKHIQCTHVSMFLVEEDKGPLINQLPFVGKEEEFETGFLPESPGPSYN